MDILLQVLVMLMRRLFKSILKNRAMNNLMPIHGNH